MDENESTIEQLRESMEKIEGFRSTRDKLKGRKEQLFETLKEKFKFTSLSQARIELKKYEDEWDGLVKRGAELVAELDEKTATPVEEFES
jgi:hypothetical protein